MTRSLTITSTPSPSILLGLWQQIEADPLRPLLLADTTDFPHAQAFLNAVGTRILPYVASTEDGESVALAWLYNVEMLPPHMIPITAFVAVYVVPQYRRQGVIQPHAGGFLDTVHAAGIEHLWAEVRLDNIVSRIILRQCGFTACAVLPAWKRYGGQWKDMELYHRVLA